MSGTIPSIRLDAQGRLINCFRSIIDRDKSSRLQVVAWLVSEEIERRPPSLVLPFSLLSHSLSLFLSRNRARTFTCTRVYILAKLAGKIEKLVPSKLTTPDLGADRSWMFPRQLNRREVRSEIGFFALVVIMRLSEFDGVT